MFNRKPNWRAGIVGLASLALLATFPLATVTASAETVEPTPAGTVEQVATAESPEVDLKELSAKADSPEGVSVERAASGYNAFRFADDDLGSSPYNRQDGLWTLSLQGEVTKVQWDTNKGRYAPKESRDIPIGTRKCSNGEFKGSWDRGVFDGLAVAGKNASTMYATYSYSNATRNNVTDDLNSGTSIYRYHHGKWHAWRLRRSGGSWKILEEEVRWSGNCSSGGTVTASYSAQTSASQGAESDRNYTFDYARTNFSSGTVINAGTDQEAYIFGGSDGTRFVGAKVHSIKMFAFLPNVNGGVVKYLGYLPVQRVDVPGQEANGPQSVFADFTTDADGNVYVAVGQGYNEGILTNPPKKLNLQVWRFPKGYIQNEIKATVPSSPNRGGRPQDGAQFDFKGRYHWGDPYNFSNSGCGANGGSSTCTSPIRVGDPQHPEWFGKRIINNNYTFTDNVDGFSGIAIAPDNHVAVGVNLSRAGGGATYGKVFEIQQDETEDGALTPLISSSLRHDDFPTTNTNFLNQEYTDIEGVLYAPPKRTLKLFKKVVGRRPYDQFVVDLNPTGTNSGTNYKINNAPDDAHKTKTSFTSANGTQAIGKKVQEQIVPTKIALPSGDFTARIGERTYEGSQRVATQGRYDTTLECSDGVTADPYVDGAGQNRYFDITVSSTAGDDLQCMIINKAKVPSAKVTVYKNFKSRDDQHYRYSVGFSNGSSEHSSVTGWQTLNADTAMRDATDIDVPVGASIKVFEKDTQSALDLGGSLNKYTVNIACYNGVRRDEQNRIGSVAGTELNLTVPAPKLASKKISCYVDNALTPKDKTVTLYKKFDRRYKNSDNFKVFAEVPLAYPLNRLEGQTTNNVTPAASESTSLGTKAFKNNATITVGEQGIDGASLDNYDTDVKCTEGGFNGRALPVAATQGRSKQFNLSNTTSSRVDCYVINKARKKVTIHKSFNRRFVDSDNFTVTATNMNKQDQSVSGTTTGTGTQNQGMNNFNPALFSNDAYLKVTETGVGSTDLSHYNTSIKCTVDGPNGASINPVGQETSTRTSYFDLSNVTSPVVDCYVTNTVPEPERTITVKKIFKNDTTTDGFGISGWFGDNSHSFNMQNTSGHTHDEVFTVSKRPIKVNSGALTAVFSEAARPDRHINLYSISVVCKGEGADPDLENITDGKTVKITGTTNGNRWDARGTIPANLTGAITCTITNELPKPKLTTVTLYKQLHRFNSGDQFNIGLYDAQTSAALSGASVNTSTVDNPEHLTNVAPSNKDYDQYVVGEHQFTQSADGFKFTVKEWATDSAKLSNYNLNLFCQHYQNGSWADFRATLDNVQNLQNGISVDVKVPAGVTGQVHCYLQNTAKPKVKVVLYKDLKRADTNDQFNVGMSKPSATGNSWDSVISPVQANNSNLTETSHYAVDAGYSRYQIGSYEYARDDETGFNFKVEETANDTDVLSKYTSNLTCKYVSNGSENTDVVTNVSEPQDNNGTRSISGVIPAGTTDAVVHCYLTNSPKPKAENKLVLFKQLKRVNQADEFFFGLYNPSTGSFSTPLGGVYPKTTGSPSTTHSTVKLEYDGKTVSYDQYKSDDYKYSDSENGFTFKISESRKETPTKVSDYVSSVTCKALDAAGQWSKINVSFGEIVTNGNTRYVVATLPAHQSGEVHCYLRNEPKPKPKTGSITIHKISSIGGSDLSGSHWKVQQRIGNSGPFKDYGLIADDDTTTVNQLHDADNRPGYIKIDNLKIGTELEPVYYRVIETVAPAGFILPTKESSRTHSFTLYPGKAFGKDAQYREKEVQNTPATSPELPFTGGWGTLPYMILGFVLTGGAVVAFVIAKPKNTKPSHK